MRDPLHMLSSGPLLSGQAREAFGRLEAILIESLIHGFFHISITCEIVNGGKRQFVIDAGKSYKFTIPEDDLPR